MEHPVKDIGPILRSLTSGSLPDLQETITKYYTPSATLTHPFVRVPSFTSLPLLPSLTSRDLILSIYKWYRLLSPSTTTHIDSTVFDQRTCTLYISLTQSFSIWFLPFHRSPVRLVTILHLEPTPTPPNADTKDHTTTPPALGGAPNEPTFAQVASTQISTSSAVDPDGTSKARQRSHGQSLSRSNSDSNAEDSGKKRYRIAAQEDLYQVNEFIKFILMAPGAVVWGWWQLMSAVLCVLGVLVLEPFMKLVGGVVHDEGQMREVVVGNGNVNGRRM